MGKSGSHGLSPKFKDLLDAFGMEWREASGEAEAELAYLNKSGVIDAVLTDDVDALIFGAKVLIKNAGVTLSGNKSKPALDQNGKISKYHVMMFSDDEIKNNPDVQLTRGGLILIAMLSGGDYHAGPDRIGAKGAYGLARCGFGDQLLAAYNNRLAEDIHQFLPGWRQALEEELQTNSRGFLPRRNRSARFDATFPDLKLLDKYVDPRIATHDGRGSSAMRDTRDPNIGALAAFCEEHFGEWGYKDAIIKRFRDLMWPAAVCRVLRRAALLADEKERDRRVAAGVLDRHISGPLRPSRHDAVGTPTAFVRRCLAAPLQKRRNTDDYQALIASAFVNRGPRPSGSNQDRFEDDGVDPDPLVVKIVGSRRHASTDMLLEYRVEISPRQLVDLTAAGIKGTRSAPGGSAQQSDAMDDEAFDAWMNSQANEEGDDGQATKATKKSPPEPMSTLRLWIPAPMMHQVHPGLVEDFTMAEEAKRNKKANKGKGKARAVAQDDDHEDGGRMEAGPSSRPSTNRARGRGAQRTSHADSGLEDFDIDMEVEVDIAPSLPGPSGSASVSQALPTGVLTPISHRPCQHANSLYDPFIEPAPARSSFLFTMPNPDEPSHSDYEGEREIDHEYEEQRPRNHMDEIFEQSISRRQVAAPRPNANRRNARARASATQDTNTEPVRHQEPRGSVVEPPPRQAIQTRTDQPSQREQSGPRVIEPTRGEGPSPSRPQRKRAACPTLEMRWSDDSNSTFPDPRIHEENVASAAGPSRPQAEMAPSRKRPRDTSLSAPIVGHGRTDKGKRRKTNEGTREGDLPRDDVVRQRAPLDALNLATPNVLPRSRPRPCPPGASIPASAGSSEIVARAKATPLFLHSVFDSDEELDIPPLPSAQPLRRMPSEVYLQKGRHYQVPLNNFPLSQESRLDDEEDDGVIDLTDV
ncbi:hypothetical protein HGRIS_002268 [Hohenbuehelia grisea]